MVQNSFQRAKGNVGNRLHSTEAKEKRCERIKIKYAIHSIGCKNMVNKSQETPE